MEFRDARESFDSSSNGSHVSPVENQEKNFGVKQEIATKENQEKATTENTVKEPARVIGRRTRAGFSGSWSSQDFSSLTMENEEGADECSPGEGLLDSSISIESEVIDECYPGQGLVDSSRSIESEGTDGCSPGQGLVDSSRSIESEGTDGCSPGQGLVDSSRSIESEGTDRCSLGEGLQESLRSLESETASSKASTSSGFFGLLRKGSGMRFQPFPSRKSVPKLTRRKTKRIRESTSLVLDSSFNAELCNLKSSWKNFSFLDLQAATNGFSPENLIGQGGYAEVYKGELSDGQLVAIKRLTKGSPEEMTMDFLSELGIIVHVDHPNIAKLIGYGVEGGMHIVLQLSPHGSLASLLYGSKEKLDWDIRYKIAVGTAVGLSYLHEGCQRRIIHKDIKASNILLTEDFEPQISDFGLSKWLPDQWTHHTVSKVEGTFGYLPPELFMHGIVDEKTDVFAYGVLLLELITGQQALDSSQKSLVMWAKPLIQKNSLKELVDPALGNAYDSDQLKRLALTAFMCVHQSASHRPQMSQVVQHLKNAESALELTEENQSSKSLLRTYSNQLHDAEEYNTTNSLNDLNRHMEIVLGPSTDI